MLRQFLIYLLLSILVVVFAKYAHLLIVYIDTIYTFLNIKLSPLFSQTAFGVIIRRVLILMLIPLVIAAFPALIYKLIKGKDMPHFIATTWVIWTVVVLSDILIR